jgi:hypothetical protein
MKFDELPENRSYELQLSTFQIGILLCFNNTDSLKIIDLINILNLNYHEIITPLKVFLIINQDFMSRNDIVIK